MPSTATKFAVSQRGENPPPSLRPGLLERFAIVVAVLFAVSTGSADAAEPIEGKWRVENGETVRVSPCGTGYCLVAETGKYKGKRIGRVSGSGLSYAGEVTDPSTDKTYEGTATIDGSSLRLTGCAFKVFCRSQTWTKL